MQVNKLCIRLNSHKGKEDSKSWRVWPHPWSFKSSGSQTTVSTGTPEPLVEHRPPRAHPQRTGVGSQTYLCPGVSSWGCRCALAFSISGLDSMRSKVFLYRPCSVCLPGRDFPWCGSEKPRFQGEFSTIGNHDRLHNPCNAQGLIKKKTRICCSNCQYPAPEREVIYVATIWNCWEHSLSAAYCLLDKHYRW